MTLTETRLVEGDPMKPDDLDLIAQCAMLPIGNPVPEGWRVLSGGPRHSSIAWVGYRYEIEAREGEHA